MQPYQNDRDSGEEDGQAKSSVPQPDVSAGTPKTSRESTGHNEEDTSDFWKKVGKAGYHLATGFLYAFLKSGRVPSPTSFRGGT